MKKITIVIVIAMLVCFTACEEDGKAIVAPNQIPETQEFETSAVITTISVDGMTCGNCVAAITRELSKIEGVNDFDVKIGKVTVEHENDVTAADIREAIMAAGGYTPLD
ncbi:MAG: heavy-metal-associated domain-containing protein [Oscillospiraceae bacterium]|nr:heavy-metal-associated domain-containing protein [Oscillospiraceae bacterium]